MYMCVYITIMLRIINKASYKILHLLDSGRKGELQLILFLLTLTVIGMGYSKIPETLDIVAGGGSENFRECRFRISRNY